MEQIFIKDVRQGMKNLTLTFIVLEVGSPTMLKENREVRTLKVADTTACINLSVWDEPGHLLIPGDIVRLTKGYANVWRNCLTLYAGKTGDLDRIGDFCMVFNEQLNMSEPNLVFENQPVPMVNMNVNNGNMNNGGKMVRATGPNVIPPPVGKNTPRFPNEQQAVPNKQAKVTTKPGRGGIRNMPRPERR